MLLPWLGANMGAHGGNIRANSPGGAWLGANMGANIGANIRANSPGGVSF